MARANYKPCGCFTYHDSDGHTEAGMCATHALEAASKVRRPHRVSYLGPAPVVRNDDGLDMVRVQNNHPW